MAPASQSETCTSRAPAFSSAAAKPVAMPRSTISGKMRGGYVTDDPRRRVARDVDLDGAAPVQAPPAEARGAQDRLGGQCPEDHPVGGCLQHGAVAGVGVREEGSVVGEASLPDCEVEALAWTSATQPGKGRSRIEQGSHLRRHEGREPGCLAAPQPHRQRLPPVQPVRVGIRSPGKARQVGLHAAQSLHHRSPVSRRRSRVRAEPSTARAVAPSVRLIEKSSFSTGLRFRYARTPAWSLRSRSEPWRSPPCNSRRLGEEGPGQHPGAFTFEAKLEDEERLLDAMLAAMARAPFPDGAWEKLHAAAQRDERLSELAFALRERLAGQAAEARRRRRWRPSSCSRRRASSATCSATSSAR